jgi:stage II sporulation protein D
MKNQMCMSRTLLWVCVFLFAGDMYGREIRVDVNLFTGSLVRSLDLQQFSGRYMVNMGNSTLTTLSQGESVVFRVKDSMIEMTEGGEVVGRGTSFEISGTGLQNSFLLKAGAHLSRHYDDDLLLEWHNGAIRMTNRVDLERYVGGVIQAEAGGSTRNVEYFMVQAMVSRTYAMRLIMQHGPRYRLTDDVSNQVYKGRPVTPEIFEAVARTVGEVILYDDSSLIDAVFHSNSGGFTMASEDVWLTALPYLRPVADTFAIGQRNYEWVHRMPAIEWLNYLAGKWNFPVHNDSLKNLALNYCQTERTKFFLNTIPLTHIRRDLKLKSTYFSITRERDEVIFRGNGFGHGVGLSQEGGIKMADMGFSAYEILQYYYTGIHVRPLSDLQMVASLGI